MDRAIRNLDGEAYRRLKARAAAEGKTIGEAVNEAIRAYTSFPWDFEKRGSMMDIKPTHFGKGSKRLSEEIDAIVYGI